MARGQPTSVRIEARIERKSPRLPRFVVVPDGVLAPWDLRATTVVEGTLNGADLGRRGLKRWDERRGWFLEIPEPLCRKAGVDTGDAVALVLCLASQELPAELSRLLESEPTAEACWSRLSASQQRMLREHVAAARQSATRARRAAAALLPRRKRA